MQVGILLPQKWQQILDVHLPQRLIEVAFANREARVPAFLRRDQVLFERILGVEKDDLAARRGDVAHHSIAHIERVDQDLFAERRHFIAARALGQE